MDKKNLYTLRTHEYDLSKRWYFEYSLEGRRKKSYGDINSFSTIAARLAAADKHLQKLLITPVRRSLHEASLEWIENNKFRWRLKSYQTIKSKISIFWAWVGVRSLVPSLIVEFLQYLGGLGRSKTTNNNYIRVLKMINSECWKIKDLFSEARTLHAEPTPAKYFTREQITYLGDKFAQFNTELSLVAQLQYYCFIRPGELRLLRVDDIELSAARILIRGEISKNKKEQYVAIPAAFAPVLSAAIAGRVPSSYLLGGDVPHRKDFFSKKHQKMLKEYRIDTTRYKLYSWKHTGVVAAVRAGIHIKELQIQLRHHSLDQVNDYLRQLGVSDLQNLQDKFPAF
jgi:integrase